MSLAGDLDPAAMDSLPADPLLKPGAFIDPHPLPDENFVPVPVPEPQPEPVSEPASFQTGPAEHHTPAGQKAPAASEFDWLPPGWTVVERVRASGASAGSRDKYYMDPDTKRRFRSKKEVLTHLGIAVTPYKRKKKDASVSDADTTPQANTKTAQKKRKKKSENTAEDLVKRFNFDDVPAKVKWELTQVYETKWQPLLNSVDKVSESCKEEWAAAFTYLTVPNEESVLL